jgi:hypothetical protein
MSKRFEEIVDRLRWLAYWGRHASDQADTKVSQVNALIRQLGEDGWVHPVAFLGAVIHERYYAPRPGGSESGQLVQAALLVPQGLGVVLWDSEASAELRRLPEGPEAEASTLFRPFADCEPALRALLLPHIEPLLERLYQRLS